MVDLLYLCHDRIVFTQKTLPTLIANTDWSMVNEFVLYHDAAGDDGETNEYLCSQIAVTGLGELRLTNLRSPVGVMNHFLARTKADIFAKIDNDIVVPPYWLNAMSRVMEENPDLELLGMEAGMSEKKAHSRAKFRYTPSSHIGGVGLMRVSAFRERPPLIADGRFGFTEWQHTHLPVRGWICPDLRVFALDQLPIEPYVGLTAKYVRQGLNREWPKYDPAMSDYWSWWL